jgi:hypothetical protein
MAGKILPLLAAPVERSWSEREPRLCLWSGIGAGALRYLTTLVESLDTRTSTQLGRLRTPISWQNPTRLFENRYRFLQAPCMHPTWPSPTTTFIRCTNNYESRRAGLGCGLRRLLNLLDFSSLAKISLAEVAIPHCLPVLALLVGSLSDSSPHLAF